ncbi:MAG: ATP-binding protein [Verrucomicrobiota bacterium]
MIFRFSPFSRRITERTVLWGLVPGFVLVVVLLGMAGLVAVRDSREIRLSATKLVKDQLLIARLLHEVQAEEDALALALHRLTTDSSAQERAARVLELKEADKSVARLASQAHKMPHAAEWRQLAIASQEFSQEVEKAFSQEGPVSTEIMESLFTSHERVVKLIHGLILLSSQRLMVVDEQMNLQLKELADESAFLLGACFLLAAGCAAATIIYVRRSVHRIEWQTDEINRVSWHMLQTQEETARRFSHELHDELGQALAALRANITSMDTDDLEERRPDCVQLVDEAISNVRELSQLLRPVILDDFGLDAGLRWLAEKFGQRTRIQVNYESSLETRLQSDTETHLFRIAQEALTNIARHSRATEVTIRLEIQGAQVHLTVQDNGDGIGPDRQESRHSLGLIGMRARARQCGGTLNLQPVSPQGLRIHVEVPLRTAEESEEDVG